MWPRNSGTGRSEIADNCPDCSGLFFFGKNNGVAVGRIVRERSDIWEGSN